MTDMTDDTRLSEIRRRHATAGGYDTWSGQPQTHFDLGYLLAQLNQRDAEIARLRAQIDVLLSTHPALERKP